LRFYYFSFWSLICSCSSSYFLFLSVSTTTVACGFLRASSSFSNFYLSIVTLVASCYCKVSLDCDLPLILYMNFP
jgi:hypothetical protein